MQGRKEEFVEFVLSVILYYYGGYFTLLLLSLLLAHAICIIVAHCPMPPMGLFEAN